MAKNHMKTKSGFVGNVSGFSHLFRGSPHGRTLLWASDVSGGLCRAMPASFTGNLSSSSLAQNDNFPIADGRVQKQIGQWWRTIRLGQGPRTVDGRWHHHLHHTYDHFYKLIFYRTQVNLGSDCWVRMSVRPSVTLLRLN